MRIHSDILTGQDFTEAARLANVLVVDMTTHRSQSRKHAYSFSLSGSGRNGGQWGTQPYKTATWDEWGIVFNHLFDVDPLAHCGKWPYLSGEHFHWVTNDRFRHLTPTYQHLRHKWNRHGRNVTGTYYVSTCDCGALQRRMIHGHDFAELAS